MTKTVCRVKEGWQFPILAYKPITNDISMVILSIDDYNETLKWGFMRGDGFVKEIHKAYICYRDPVEFIESDESEPCFFYHGQIYFISEFMRF